MKNSYEFGELNPKISTKLFPWYSIIGFLIASGLAIAIWFTGSNQELFITINQLHTILPSDVWSMINMVTYSKYFIMSGLLVLFTLFGRRDKLLNSLFLIFLFYLVVAGIKHIAHEARPYVVLAPDSFFWLKTFEDISKSAYQSFPSGHTGNVAMFAFAMNYLFFSRNKTMQFMMLLLVVIVALSRVCTGWHWPLDVLASGLISYILVKISYSLSARKSKGLNYQ